ncbi:endocuticle structural glycoprotein SgAbd-1-like [Neodiprion pinetum]|uniref:Endocuticle structural glycoprotein SgAbd-1 n=1 Tax=Neodiprion lecontei TaxID=441921 RepID=A0A6J0BUV1_NEOLC|nr:endocuticle structural glycoprotein SgAbd-1 [Neodiprion lecontei]XP_046421200.1 endocuticle structural glycoprotein SgAbd-1-like [Neodiprion fabricii]XP_046464954.1 endocuticle structural glycoprotein SgAbd-1-like [Neodiprion pinetum]XP_046630548.1 endocuticle structural glycoprotein SgAbd-1-like [Neodiprion virginianus]
MYTALVTLLALTACALARPADEPIAIVAQTQDGPNPDGSYKWSYESANGIKAEEEGSVVNAGAENESTAVQGGYSYTGEDGVVISLTYKAGEEGFQPEGAHIPTAPPIPEAIQKALEWNAAHPSKEDENQV